MRGLTEFPNGTFLLKVPFETIDTAVWLLQNEDKIFLIDCATTAFDVEAYILPAINELKKSKDTSVTLLLSHAHSDHAGGASALLSALPHLSVYAADPARYPFDVSPLRDGDVLGGFLEVLCPAGHSSDICTFFDRRTDTLYTADTLQWSGVSRYGTGVTSPMRYIEAHLTLARKNAAHLFASHSYFPHGGEAHGRAEVRRMIAASLSIFRTLVADVIATGTADPSAVAAALTERRQDITPAHPPVPVFTVRSILKEGAEALLEKADEALSYLI